MDCTHILRNVLKKKNYDAYQEWVGEIRKFTEEQSGLANITKFAVHDAKNFDKLKPSDKLIFIVVIRFDSYNNMQHYLQHPTRGEIMRKTKAFLLNYEEFMAGFNEGHSLVGKEEAFQSDNHMRLPIASLMHQPKPKLTNIPIWKNVVVLMLQLYPCLLCHAYAGTIPEMKTVHAFRNDSIIIFLLLMTIVPFILYVTMPLVLAIPGVYKWMGKPRSTSSAFGDGLCCWCSQIVNCLGQGCPIFKPKPPPPLPYQLLEAEAHLGALRGNVTELEEKVRLLDEAYHGDSGQTAEVKLEEVSVLSVANAAARSHSSDGQDKSVTLSIHVFIKWEYSEAFRKLIERFLAEDKP